MKHTLSLIPMAALVFLIGYQEVFAILKVAHFGEHQFRTLQTIQNEIDG